MNKSELISAIAARSNISKTVANQSLNAFMSVVTETLSKGDSVVLVGFGTYGTKKRAKRAGRNPKTGASIVINAATVPFFKPGKKLKTTVNS